MSPRDPRDKGTPWWRGLRGTGVGKGLEDQAEEPHSVIILHLNKAWLW